MLQIPYCFHPSRVMFVDDNVNFLSQLPMSLNSNNSYLYESDPRKALEHINNHTPSPSIIEALRNGDLNNSIENLFKEMYNPDRFNRISTIVVDYDMPEMNGLDLLKNIKNPHIQKILLTGAANEQIAVEAFNQGLIQHFISKSGNSSYDRLNEFIEKSNFRFFNSFSQTYMNSIRDLHVSPLNDRAFIDFFSDFLSSNNIVEFYLRDFSGSFLCADSNTNTSMLFVFNQEMITYHDDEIKAFMSEDKKREFLSENLINDIKNRKIGFCFDYINGKEMPSSSGCQDYLFSLNKIKGEKQDYFYAYAPNYPIASDKPIYSFFDFNKKILQNSPYL